MNKYLRACGVSFRHAFRHKLFRGKGVVKKLDSGEVPSGMGVKHIKHKLVFRK
jgi:hypothetical protein